MEVLTNKCSYGRLTGLQIGKWSHKHSDCTVYGIYGSLWNRRRKWYRNDRSFFATLYPDPRDVNQSPICNTEIVSSELSTTGRDLHLLSEKYEKIKFDMGQNLRLTENQI